jgi:outer membrane receptor protein involved in Fe transport
MRLTMPQMMAPMVLMVLTALTALARVTLAQDSPTVTYGAKAKVRTAPTTDDQQARATSVVTRRQMDERVARSAPDALRFEPGVYVQQTAHGQGSPYVRGLTGQQVLLMFDGVRLNNGIYRQGPNQYFFTVDSNTIDHISVVRGSASTLYGPDAIGGAVMAAPIQPTPNPELTRLQLHPRGIVRAASADSQLGGRVQLGADLDKKTSVLAGYGYRHVGLLRSGGPVYNPADGKRPQVPAFAPDGVTQLGTGFDEGTFDAQVAHQASSGLTLKGALWGYRQTDAPRTDQCPPPFAPQDDCLTIAKQYRTLGYVALRGNAGPAMPELDLTLSWQNYLEARELDRPSAFARTTGTDTVDTLGIAFRAASPWWSASRDVAFRLRYGADSYYDTVDSEAALTLTDVGATYPYSRGQYIQGSNYWIAGAFAESEVQITKHVTVKAGGRLNLTRANTRADVASGTEAVSNDVTAFVGRAGVEGRLNESWTLLANLDQGFRPPNLDDLTSRSQTGPGFQFENPNLQPERSLTAEVGMRAEATSRSWLERVTVHAWAYNTWLWDSMLRALRMPSDCPPQTPQCVASWSRYQLVNAEGVARITGAEGLVTADFGRFFSLRATLNYAFGSAQNQAPEPSVPSAPYDERVPLSRIPPLNGTGEFRWSLPSLPNLGHYAFYTTAAVRWAAAQTRLAPTDLTDARIPLGGTPGYVAADLRAGVRYMDHVLVALVLENLFDAAYRVHGSSVNGPGRGVMLMVNVGM